MEFAEFYESARDECLRIVLLNVGDRQLADDLDAEAFAWAWTSWPKVRELQVPRAWVVRTALNAHVSWRRRRRRKSPSAATTPRYPQVRMTRSAATCWQRCGGCPSVSGRSCLRLLLDLDTETTARLLGIGPGTVGAHLHRAVATLRAAIPTHDSQEIST